MDKNKWEVNIGSRCIYNNIGQDVGVAETPELAAQIVKEHNYILEKECAEHALIGE